MAKALRLDLLPGRNFREIVEARRASGDKAAVKTLLAESLPRRLAERWLDLEGFAQPTPPLARLEERLHAWSVIPAGSEGFEKAEVTGGGVSTGDLDSKTMQARNAPGLFPVPVDGQTMANAMAMHEDGSAVTADAPAQPGEAAVCQSSVCTAVRVLATACERDGEDRGHHFRSVAHDV